MSMTFRAVLFLAALAVRAQTYEIRGTVTEAGAGGVPGADVTILRIEDGATKKTQTDAQGVFRVTVDMPGAYTAGVGKEGYASSGFQQAFFRVDAGQPQTNVSVALARVGEVTGRVIDEETREPVAGVEIALLTKQWRLGQLNFGAPRMPVATNAEGIFRFTGLPPGEYIVSARQRPSSIQKLDNFAVADANKIDEDYPATYWPGGGDAASAFGAVLTPGGYADVGTIQVRKFPQYRVLVTMANCPEGEAIRLSVVQRNGGAASAVGPFPCGKNFLLRGFDSGSAVLYAMSERRGGDLSTTVSGVASVEVVDKNLSVTIPLQRNVVIQGELIVADGAKAPRLLPRITSGPFDLLAGTRVSGDSAILWAPDQRHFQLAVSPRTQSLNVYQPEGAYIREIRYNGVALRGSTLPINPGVAGHKLEIVMDDKWGSLAVSVTDGSRGVPASVLIVRDTLRVEDLADPTTFTRDTGADGTLSAVQLGPGDYRVLAVASAQARRMHERAVLERLLSTAQRVTVSPGGSQTVPIRVSDVR